MRTVVRSFPRLATCLLLGAGAKAPAGQFEVLPVPLLDHDLKPEQQLRVERSSVHIPPRQLPPATALPLPAPPLVSHACPCARRARRLQCVKPAPEPLGCRGEGRGKGGLGGEASL